MIIRRLAFVLAFTAVASSGAPAFAACGNGQIPNYRDIAAVRYEKTACYGVCPSYEVSFSRGGLSYTGRANVARMGDYTSSETGKFSDVVALLSKFDFYSFKVKPVFVTDVPHFIVEVQRCGVATKIDWPALVWPGVSGTHDLRDLFKGLDRITNSVAWHKAG
jgi:hypothetical protein